MGEVFSIHYEEFLPFVQKKNQCATCGRFNGCYEPWARLHCSPSSPRLPRYQVFFHKKVEKFHSSSCFISFLSGSSVTEEHLTKFMQTHQKLNSLGAWQNFQALGKKRRHSKQALLQMSSLFCF